MGRKPVMAFGAAMDAALSALARGGVIAYPTETFYALGADPRKRPALSRLRRLKGRVSSKPLLLIACSRHQALSLVRAPHPRRLGALARRFWPGALTLVLPPRSPALAGALGRSRGLAVRVTSQPLARLLIRRYGFPITGTSANPARGKPARRAAQVESAFGPALDSLLDGGVSRGGRPSTLIDLTCTPPRLLRRGAISLASLRRVIPDLIFSAAPAAASERTRSGRLKAP